MSTMPFGRFFFFLFFLVHNETTRRKPGQQRSADTERCSCVPRVRGLADRFSAGVLRRERALHV